MSDRDDTLNLEELAGDRPLTIPEQLPILPLRDTVLFPNSFMPLAVARESSVRLIDEAISGGKLIGVFTQRDAGVEEPQQEDLYRVGTASHIHKMFKLPDGSLRLIVQGLARLQLEQVIETRPYLRASVTLASEASHEADQLEIDALMRNIKTNFQQVVSISPLLSDDLQTLAATSPEGETIPLVVPPGLRVGVRRLVEPVLPALPIISFAELPVAATLRSVGTWEVRHAA